MDDRVKSWADDLTAQPVAPSPLPCLACRTANSDIKLFRTANYLDSSSYTHEWWACSTCIEEVGLQMTWRLAMQAMNCQSRMTDHRHGFNHQGHYKQPWWKR